MNQTVTTVESWISSGLKRADAKQVFKVPSDLTWANYLTAYSEYSDMKLVKQE